MDRHGRDVLTFVGKTPVVAQGGLSRQLACRERPLHLSVMRRETTAATTISIVSQTMSLLCLRNHLLVSSRRALIQCQ